MEEKSIYRLAQKFLADKAENAKMAMAFNPYGDGQAAERIVEATKRGLSSKN